MINARSSEKFLFRAKTLKSCIFYLLARPAETAYLTFQDRELSNDLWLVEWPPRKVVVHTFLGVVPSQADETAFVANYRTPSMTRGIPRMFNGFPKVYGC